MGEKNALNFSCVFAFYPFQTTLEVNTKTSLLWMLQLHIRASIQEAVDRVTIAAVLSSYHIGNE